MAGRKAEKPTKQDMVLLYVEQEKTTREIAQLFDCSARTVARCLHEYEIQSRNPGSPRRRDLEDREWLESEYRRKPIDTIADEQGVSSGVIRRIFRDLGIQSNPQGTPKGHKFSQEVRQKMSDAKKGKDIGPDNWNWRGGDSKPSKERRSYAAKQWRNAVRERDNYTCQKCGATERIHAHHIKAWKDYPRLRYDVNNGISLCVKCHQKEHGFPFPSWLYNKGKRPTSAEHPKG